MRSTAALIRKDIRALGNPDIAEHSQKFFCTGKGEYGEGDRFLGIRVPVVRKQVKVHRDAKLAVITAILKSKWHEERLFAVLSLADRYASGNEEERRKVFRAYVDNLQFVNNWDLVDGSAHLIIGPWLNSRSRRMLYRLARSTNLWERRIAIMSTYHFIKNSDFTDTIRIAEILLHDEHDLIHKAVGWMLREVGNRQLATEERFLKKHNEKMPRTMLRYAIEKFPEKTRKAYLHGRI